MLMQGCFAAEDTATHTGFWADVLCGPWMDAIVTGGVDVSAAVG